MSTGIKIGMFPYPSLLAVKKYLSQKEILGQILCFEFFLALLNNEKYKCRILITSWWNISGGNFIF